MNTTLYYFCFISFLILPILLLSIRYFRPCTLTWGAVAIFLTVVGWVLVNGTVYFGFEHLGEMIENHPDLPDEWTEQWVSDGAPRVFALMLGWLYGPVYSIPFLLLYGVVSILNNKSYKSQESNAEAD